MKIFKSFAHIVLSLAILVGSSFASISNQTARIGPFIPSALPATLSVTFPYQNSSDLTVLNLGQGGTTNDPAIVLTLNSDYTVTGGGYNSSTQMQTGNVIVNSTGTHPVLPNDYIVILRNTPVTQTTTFSSTGILTGPMIEKALDKGITVSQQLTEEASRALRFEPGETLDGTLIRSARAGKVLGFDSTGAIAYSAGGGGAGTTYTAGAGLQLNSNQFSVLPAQSFTDLTVTNPIVGSVTGNAATATKLLVSRSINGVAFDGTTDIVVPAAAGTLTGATLAANVTAAPGLLSTSIGTLGSMAIQNSGAVNISGGAIAGASVTGLPAPSLGTDAATKTYVDNNSTGITQRTGVVAATTANITLSAPQTIDGQSVIAGNRVLVKNQTTTSQNGIYDVAAGSWTRSSDSNTAAQLKVGYYYFVSSGTTQGATGWTIQTAPTVLNTDPVVFGQFSASTTYTAGAGLNLVGNIFSVNPALTLVGGSANNMPIGQSTPNLVSSSGGALNGSIGLGTPSSGAFTALASLTSAAQTSLIGNFVGSFINNSNSATAFGLRVQSDTVSTTGVVLAVQSSIANHLRVFGDGHTEFAGASSVINASGFNGGVGATTPAAGTFTTLNSTGGALNGTLGATTPAAATVTTLASSSNANIRTTKANLHLTVNVKDYGATGNGSTDDGPAIGTALAALTNHGTLYFPPGKYNLATGIGDANNLSYITVTGVGAELYNTNHSNTMVFNSNCDHIEICNLMFTGDASVRGTGIHVRMYASNSSIHDNYFQGCSDFAIHVSNSGAAYTSNVSVTNNIIDSTLGDGIHVGSATDVLVEGNNINSTGDDGVGVVADSASFPPTRVTVTGNRVFHSASAGVRVDEGVDVFVTNNDINTTAGSGIDVGRYTSTTAYNARINISGNRLYNAVTTLGPLGAIWMKFCNESVVDGNKIFDNPTGYGIALLDFNDMTITNNYIRGCASRGIGTDDTTTTNVASPWTSLMICNNTFQYVVANQTIYAVPPTGKAINNSVICNNTANQVPGPDWIFYTRCNTIVIANNTSRDGLNVTGAGTGVRLINNN